MQKANNLTSNNKITREEILNLQESKKTKDNKNSFLKLIMPIIFGIIAILEYAFIKNNDGANTTNVYIGFLVFLILIYIIRILLSRNNQTKRNELIYKSSRMSFLFIILIIYDVLTLKTGILALPYFPWVDMVFNSMVADKSYLLSSLLNSLKLLFLGYFIGGFLGLITGILAGYFNRVNYWVEPFLKFIGPIPTTTWLPIIMAIAVSLFQGAVFIIALGVWFSVTLATITGIRNVNKSYFEVASTLGANSNELVRKIAIPSALPSIFQGLIAGMSSACNALIVAEMLGVESGLGWYITWKSSWADYSSMVGAIILLASTFILVNYGLKKISKKALRWKEGEI